MIANSAPFSMFSLVVLAFMLTFLPVFSRESFTADINDQSETSKSGLQLRSFEFNVVTTDSNGRVIDRRGGQARYYIEDLAGVRLEMVDIPAGTFLMGTSLAEAAQVNEEYRRHLGEDTKHYGDRYVPQQIPQHSVRIESFFLGKYEVTQAQWRAVARLPKVNRDLVSDPSFFKGDDLPVEEVTWEDAIEFCKRLSRATGREYRLPSEAEWEYACRAGTVTQFHFGDTINPELANCNGKYLYGSVTVGLYRERTTPVGSFEVANAFGLYDMHGNVEEWCMDPWHESYNGAPRDGRVWILGGNNNFRVVRGGSWLQMAAYNRAASRAGRWWTRNKTYDTGFRVAVSGFR